MNIDCSNCLNDYCLPECPNFYDRDFISCHDCIVYVDRDYQLSLDI